MAAHLLLKASLSLNGLLTQNADGVFRFMPNNDFEGSDKFEYTVRDDDGDTSTAFCQNHKGKIELVPNIS